MSKEQFLKGTLILTCTGLLCRLAGFFYRIFLSHTIGAQGVGIYQLSLPSFCFAACNDRFWYAGSDLPGLRITASSWKGSAGKRYLSPWNRHLYVFVCWYFIYFI